MFRIIAKSNDPECKSLTLHEVESIAKAKALCNDLRGDGFISFLIQREAVNEVASHEAALTELNRAAAELQPCERCGGTGQFITGMHNGKLVGPGGICFRCAGKGFQTNADERRNWGYDNFGRKVYL